VILENPANQAAQLMNGRSQGGAVRRRIGVPGSNHQNSALRADKAQCACKLAVVAQNAQNEFNHHARAEDVDLRNGSQP
jgi:hypothetical protein